MDAMAHLSCDAYRGVVRQDERFIDFFQQLTPVNELGRMNIGSRPAKRRAHGSIDTLRAIPWIFAWTQVGGPRASSGQRAAGRVGPGCSGAG
jgi:phosphoenolpyruvate carboxylase